MRLIDTYLVMVLVEGRFEQVELHAKVDHKRVAKVAQTWGITKSVQRGWGDEYFSPAGEQVRLWAGESGWLMETWLEAFNWAGDFEAEIESEAYFVAADTETVLWMTLAANIEEATQYYRQLESNLGFETAPITPHRQEINGQICMWKLPLLGKTKAQNRPARTQALGSVAAAPTMA